MNAQQTIGALADAASTRAIHSSVVVTVMKDAKPTPPRRGRAATGRCTKCGHDAWLHRAAALAPLFDDVDDDECERCYDCSGEQAIDDDATA